MNAAFKSDAVPPNAAERSRAQEFMAGLRDTAQQVRGDAMPPNGFEKSREPFKLPLVT